MSDGKYFPLCRIHGLYPSYHALYESTNIDTDHIKMNGYDNVLIKLYSQAQFCWIRSLSCSYWTSFNPKEIPFQDYEVRKQCVSSVRLLATGPHFLYQGPCSLENLYGIVHLPLKIPPPIDMPAGVSGVPELQNHKQSFLTKQRARRKSRKRRDGEGSGAIPFPLNSHWPLGFPE